MSYEGYDQFLCIKGHYSTQSAYDYDFYHESNHDHPCPICGASIAWWNCVDTTNGSFELNPETGQEERIDGYIELEIDRKPDMCTCHCGHVHEIEPARYKIPLDKGHLTSHFVYLQSLETKKQEGSGA